MTYEEALEMADKNKNVVGETYNGIESFSIKYLLIAPRYRTIKEKTNLLNENPGKPIDNKIALGNLNWLNESLDVYVIGEKESIYTIKLLNDHLSSRSVSPLA
jgi:hypothetical protein